MSIRAVQQGPIIVAVGRIQERRQKYSGVYISVVERLQDIASVLAARTMKMSVNDQASPRQPFIDRRSVPGAFEDSAIGSVFPVSLQSVLRCAIAIPYPFHSMANGSRTATRPTSCTARAKNRATA